MPDIGGSIGDALSGMTDSIGRAAGAAVEGVVNAFVTIPGGPIWLVVLAVLVASAWILAKR